jgi:hypothetical protein
MSVSVVAVVETQCDDGLWREGLTLLWVGAIRASTRHVTIRQEGI